MASIKAIDTASVHRLHAGQVVLELQGAVKELVENSLDAGATTIEVRFKDNGLDSVEVMDNGSGIAEADWEYIGRKHHTSKLADITSLPQVTTFGFRGEALAALCALCESVTVVTATKETAPMGAVIQLGRDGTVKDSSGRVARPRGTTITLQGLFVPLPVRRKEFERTIKREFTKALNLLYAYALVPASTSLEDGRSGVRLKVESVGPGKAGKRSTLLMTDGRGSLRSSLTAVWGPKSLEGVIDIDLMLDVEVDAIMARREGITTGSQNIRICGLISSGAWGQGRSSPDRQFYYINGRPCDLKQVGRAINEVYKSFNTHQSPLAIMDFQIPPESVDINVSPDKRTIFVHSETNLIAALRTALEEFFAPSRSSYAVAGASSTSKVVQHTQTQLDMAMSKPIDTTEEDDYGLADDAKMRDAEKHIPSSSRRPVSGPTSRTTLSEAGPSRLSSPQRTQRSQAADASDEESSYAARPQASDHSTLPSSRSRVRPSSPEPLHPTSSNPRTREPRRSSPIDETMHFEGEVEITRPKQTTSTRRRPKSPPPVPRFTQNIIDTTTASWSPDKTRKRGAPSISGVGKSGKEARNNLRTRLAGFASQGAISVRNGESGDELSDEEEVAPSQLEVPDTDLEEENDDGVDDEVDDGSMSVEEDDAIEGHETGGPSTNDTDDETLDHTEAIDVSDSHPPARTATYRTDTTGQSASRRNATSTPALARESSGYRDEISSTNIQGELTLRFDLPRIRARYKALSTRTSSSRSFRQSTRDAFSTMAEGSITAAAGIQNRDSARAEQALSRVISKADFDRMQVLGQFNKGFIIARLTTDHDGTQGEGGKGGSDDLFIIDQHASDEKYNFETLQRTTVIKAQSLIKPRPLQLTAGDEIVAMENMDVLRANGFEVTVDEDQAPGRGERIKLSAMPVSKDTTFDFKDLEQLIHLLADGARPAGQMVRCTKARSMFASRACRKSVMIGKSLTKNQMTQLLHNMGTIDQPWNCPHGRPTMRHLTKIEPSKRSMSGVGRIRWDAYTSAS